MGHVVLMPAVMGGSHCCNNKLGAGRDATADQNGTFFHAGHRWSAAERDSLGSA